MSALINPPELLHQLKREDPFAPFDIVTNAGERVFVGGRFLFGFNKDYVLVLDERDRPIRVRFSAIVGIEKRERVTMQ